jgi:hypothetical protein
MIKHTQYGYIYKIDLRLFTLGALLFGRGPLDVFKTSFGKRA